MITVFSAATAFAQCYPDAACYGFRRYLYGGGTYCHRWNTNALNNIGVLGSIVAGQGQPPISQSTISSLVFDAYATWFSNSFLPVYLQTAGPDTSGSKCRVAVINNADFSAYFDEPSGETPLAVTRWSPYPTSGNYYPDGTVKYGCTYLRGTNTHVFWADCAQDNCSAIDYDMSSVLIHELGHWWELTDVYSDPAACLYPTMYGLVEGNTTWHRTIGYADQQAVRLLFDSPTNVVYQLTASPGPAADTLRWIDVAPAASNHYYLGVSDVCWGPFESIGSFDYNDPALTSDGVHYQYITPAPYLRPYEYQLSVPAQGGLAFATSNRTQGATPSPPSAPTNVAASAIALSSGGAVVNLSWSPSAGTVTGYYLYRHWLHLTDCSVREQRPWDVLGPFEATAYSDSEPPTGDSLFYRVRAVNSTGGSELSAEAGVNLTEPLAVVAPAVHEAQLRSVWPNPTWGLTAIAYSIPVDGRVEIRVFDIAGRQLEVIARGREGAGDHVAMWHGSAVAGGESSVFVRLVVDGRPIGSRRIVLR